MTRTEAKEKQLTRYSTGVPCVQGHLADRVTSSGICVECNRISAAKHRERNPTYQSEASAKHRAAHPDKIKQYYAHNKDRISEYQKRYREENPEKRKATQANYKETYRKRELARTVARKLEKIHRTPAWSETEAIREFYENCPEGYQVDHVIPLKGKIVSGLHVIGNLQYLEPIPNMSKGNKFSVLTITPHEAQPREVDDDH